MRYLVSLACVLVVVALPLSVGAQAEEESGSRLEQWHPEAFSQPARPNTDGLEWDLWAPQPATEPSRRLPTKEEVQGKKRISTRGGRIALGLAIPIMAAVVIGGAVVAGVAATY